MDKQHVLWYVLVLLIVTIEPNLREEGGKQWVLQSRRAGCWKILFRHSRLFFAHIEMIIYQRQEATKWRCDEEKRSQGCRVTVIPVGNCQLFKNSWQ